MIAIALGLLAGGSLLAGADAGPVKAPPVKYVSAANPGQASVSGTLPHALHDWTVKGNAVEGSAEFTGAWKTDGKPGIQSIDLTIPVVLLQEHRGAWGWTIRCMMRLGRQSSIRRSPYQMMAVSLESLPTAQDPARIILTPPASSPSPATPISLIYLDLAVISHEDGHLTITTGTGLKMTDFGVSPPTAMVGIDQPERLRSRSLSPGN